MSNEIIFNNEFFQIEIITHLNDQGKERYEFQIFSKLTRKHSSDLKFAARKSTCIKWAMKDLEVFAKKENNAIHEVLASNPRRPFSWLSIQELIAA